MNKTKVLGLLGLCARAGKIVSGTDACLEEMNKKKVKLVLVTLDASEKTKKNMQYYALKEEIPIGFYGTIEEVSKAIGKENRAILGIKDANIAKEIRKVIEGVK